MTFRFPVIKHALQGDMILTISGVRSIGVYIHIGNDFVKVEFSRSNRFVIFIANDKSFCIIKVIWNRGNH